MEAYVVHNLTERLIRLTGPKHYEPVNLKPHGQHCFKSPHEYLMFKKSIDTLSYSRKVRLETIRAVQKGTGPMVSMSGTNVPTKETEKQNTEASKEIQTKTTATSDASVEKVASVKLAVKKLQTEYRNKETSAERKAEIKKEVGSLKKTLKDLK